MEFAIKQLEHAENILKDMLDTEYRRVNKTDEEIMEKLGEIQTAILVLSASQEIINIGKLQALKTIQK